MLPSGCDALGIYGLLGLLKRDLGFRALGFQVYVRFGD